MPFAKHEDLVRYRKAYNAKPLAKKRRAANNKARRMMIKKVGKAALRGKDVHHIHAQKNGGKTTMSNLRVMSRSKNRAKKPRK